MQDPVVAAYALAELGGEVCQADRTAGAGLFRDSLSRINTLPDDAFGEARQRLPVSSLSRLWRIVTRAAFHCDPALAQFVTTASDKLRDDPDHAAQLADSAMAASDPSELEVASVATFLPKLRERAPDLAAASLLVKQGVALGVACYECEQAGERFLKALLTMEGIAAPRSVLPPRLKLPLTTAELCYLSPYGIDSWWEPDLPQARRAVKIARKIQEAVKALLPPEALEGASEFVPEPAARA